MDNPSLVVTAHGGPEVLRVQDRAVPQPQEHEVLVECVAAGVNFIDIYQRQGVYPSAPPYVLGLEGAGTVVSVGSAVRSLSVGDRVAWPFQMGSAARYLALPEASVVTVPTEVPLETAAAGILQGLTAHFLVRSTYAVRPGDWALVHAAAGGVGQLLVQWITALGGRVIATAGSEEKCATALRLGAVAALDYTRTENLAGVVRERTGGQGVDVAYDGVGRDTFDASLASLRLRGMLVLFGGASGQVPPFDLQRLNAAGSVYVTRPSLPHYLEGEGELAWRAGELFSAIADGTLSVAIGGRYPLAEAARAYADLEGRRTQGKLLLLPHE